MMNNQDNTHRSSIAIWTLGGAIMGLLIGLVLSLAADNLAILGLFVSVGIAVGAGIAVYRNEEQS